jgi:predicted PurR-regulated permease PerM
MFGRNKKELEITVSNQTILRIIGFIIGTVLLINFLASIRHPLTLIIVSVFLNLALNPAVTAVSNRLRSKSRVRATAIAYVAVITLLIAFFSLVLPSLIGQTADFVRETPQTLRGLKEQDSPIGDFVRRYNLEAQVVQIANDWAQDTGNIADQAVGIANRVISNLISIITVLILTFMMLVEGPKWTTLFWRQFPKSKRDQGQKLAKKMHAVVTGFVNGQMLVAATGAFFAVVALFISTTLFNVTTINPIAFGGIVFLFSLIPTIGVFISTAIVVTFSLFVSAPLAITMLIFLVLYQQIENATIQPYIQSRANELTPLIVFLAVIVGVGFGGILGAIISIPIVGCLKVLFDEYVVNKKEPIEEEN